MRRLRWLVLAMIVPTAAYAAVELAGGGGDDCPPTSDCPCAH